MAAKGPDSLASLGAQLKAEEKQLWALDLNLQQLRRDMAAEVRRRYEGTQTRSEVSELSTQIEILKVP